MRTHMKCRSVQRPQGVWTFTAALVCAMAMAGTSAAQIIHSNDTEDETREKRAQRLAELEGLQDPALAPVEIPAMNRVLAPAFNVDEAGVSVQSLKFAFDGPLTKVQVRLGSVVRTLELSLYSMRSPDCVFQIQDETGLKPILPPAITTYRGRLIEDPRSTVAASIFEGRLRAHIRDGFDQVWGIESAGSVGPQFPADWHVVYFSTAVQPAGGDCGVTDRHFLNPQAQQPAAPFDQLRGAEGDEGGIAGGAGDGRTTIAFDADFEFYQDNGSSTPATIADIEWVMNTVSIYYQGQMNGGDPICYDLNGITVRTVLADPYSSTNSGTLLCQFIGEWETGAYPSHDVAHLFTGKDLDGTIIGLAYVGVVCDFVFNISSDCGGGVFNSCNAHYGLSQFITNDINRFQLTAHELGHNWNACHCNQSTCTGGAADPDCAIMNSSINGSTTFGFRARAAIDGYRDGTANCLTDCMSTLYVNNDPVPGGIPCFGLQIGTTSCWFQAVTTGYANVHWAGGTMRIAPGTYLGAVLMDDNANVPLLLRRWNNGEAGNPEIGGN